MITVGRVGSNLLDKAVYGRAPVRAIEEMSVEELEARFRVMRERVRLARWGGRVLGAAGLRRGQVILPRLVDSLVTLPSVSRTLASPSLQ
jgi:hypothetical protein